MELTGPGSRMVFQNWARILRRCCVMPQALVHKIYRETFLYRASGECGDVADDAGEAWDHRRAGV